MKKKYLYIALFFEFLVCLGAYLVQYFTVRKLGMQRWVNHLCNKLSRSVDLDKLNLVLMICVSLLAFAVLVWMLKRLKEKNSSLTALAVAAFGAIGIYLVWTIRYTRRLKAAYYLVSAILLLGVGFVLACWALAVRKSKINR